MADKNNETAQNQALEPENIRDVAIIGAGPVGLFAVFQCGMLGLQCHVVDSLEEIGGQCSALYPEKPIYDIPAYPEILAQDLVNRLEEQAAPFKPKYHLDQKIVSISDNNGLWVLKTDKSTDIGARTIIIAGGAGAFGPNKPPLEGIETYEGRSVFYMVRQKDSFKGKRVVIAGGGDSAVDWALSLCDITEKLYVVHRRDKFRAAPESVSQLQALAGDGKIELVTPYQLKALDGQDGQIESVHVEDMEGNVRTIEADILLPFYGLKHDLGPIATWGLSVEKNQLSVRPSDCSTNQAGIYAIGDIVTYDDKLQLILTGFAEGAQAAHAIYRYIYPDKALHFEYSTTKGIPDAA